MQKHRIQLWPPGGGDPVEVFKHDAGQYKTNGWTDKNPAAKPKRVKKEGRNNGNSSRK